MVVVCGVCVCVRERERERREREMGGECLRPLHLFCGDCLLIFPRLWSCACYRRQIVHVRNQGQVHRSVHCGRLRLSCWLHNTW